MLIRVKEEGFGIRKIERTEGKERNDRSREREEERSFGKVYCLITILRWRLVMVYTIS